MAKMEGNITPFRATSFVLMKETFPCIFVTEFKADYIDYLSSRPFKVFKMKTCRLS